MIMLVAKHEPKHLSHLRSRLNSIKPSYSPIWAQTKPSVPEFTLKLEDHSYDVPPTYSVDPYTGKNVTHAGYHVENKTIEVTIKNQPYVPYVVQEGTANWTVYFYHNVRVKGQYAENWTTLYSGGRNDFPTASNSDYTTITCLLTLNPTRPEQGYTLEYYDFSTNSYTSRLSGLPSNAQLDFQVEALIGYVHRGYNPNTTDLLQMWPWIFTGEESGWSSTQTIIINASTSSPTPSPSPTPIPSLSPSPTPSISPSDSPTQQPTLEPTQSANPTIAPSSYGIDPLPYILAIVALVIVAIALLGLTIYFRKQRNKKPAN